jgi:glycosyltransferase involved in cell wall biosynthesis
MVNECGESYRHRIEVIHCGVDTGQFQWQERRREPGALFQILCVASYEEVKGHRYLVEACRLLEDRSIPFTCHLVGYGPLQQQVEQHIETLGLEAQFHIHGGLPREKVLQMHTLADVLVLPSVPTRSGKKEGIPVVLMEGMSSGLPVISSRLSGIPELVQDGKTGFLVAPCDIVGLADALETLYRDPELRRRMGLAGREFVMAEFDLKQNARKLFSVFKK